MTVHSRSASAFLAGHRIAVVGVSDDPANFGRTVFRALADKGYDVVPVHPSADTVAGTACYPDVDSVPGTLDGVVVMVGADRSADVVEACVRRGVDKVWLFKGLGSKGAVSPEALALCDEHGIDVVAGACPIMFLEPVSLFHRIHRAARHATGALDKAS